MRFVRSWLLLLLVGLAFPSLAAKVDPPSDLLRKPTTTVVAADFREIGPGGRYVFDDVEQLSGALAAPALLDLSGPAQLVDVLHPGERYVLAFVSVKTTKLKRVVASADGGAIAVGPGLDPALWPDTPNARRLALWDPGADRARQLRRLPALLDMLGDDPSSQQFAAAEIALRPVLARGLGKAAQARLRTFVLAAAAPPSARAMAMDAVFEIPRAQLEAFWDDTAIALLEALPVAAPTDGEAGLVLTALRLLDHLHAPVDTRVLTRWLRGSNTALAESALLGLRRRSAQAEWSALEAALAERDLPEDTRRFLLDHRRRLLLGQERS